MSYIRTSKPSRRKMLWRAAAASGLGAIFKMTEGPAAAQAQGAPAGRGQNAPPAGAAPSDALGGRLILNVHLGLPPPLEAAGARDERGVGPAPVEPCSAQGEGVRAAG